VPFVAMSWLRNVAGKGVTAACEDNANNPINAATTICRCI